MILALDPSFTSTGVCLLGNDLSYIQGEHFKSGCDVYHPFGNFYKAGQSIIDQVDKFIMDNCAESLDVIVETPALATSSGAYLGVLSGMLCHYFTNEGIGSSFSVKSLTFVPCTACNSFIGNKVKTKSYIVDYCKSHKWIPEKRINNDICTAVVLGHILDAINNNKYKNAFIRI